MAWFHCLRDGLRRFESLVAVMTGIFVLIGTVGTTFPKDEPYSV